MKNVFRQIVTSVAVVSLFLDPRWGLTADAVRPAVQPASLQSLFLTGALSGRAVSDGPFRFAFPTLGQLDAAIFRSLAPRPEAPSRLRSAAFWTWKYRTPLYVTAVLTILAVRMMLGIPGDHTSQSHASLETLIASGLLLCRRPASKEFRQLTAQLKTLVDTAPRFPDGEGRPELTAEQAVDRLSATEQIPVDQLARIRAQMEAVLENQDPLPGAEKIIPHIFFVQTPNSDPFFSVGERRSTIHYSAAERAIYIPVAALEALQDLTEGGDAYDAALGELAVHAWNHMTGQLREGSRWVCNLDGKLEERLLLGDAAGDAADVAPLSKQDEADLTALTQDVRLSAARPPLWLSGHFHPINRTGKGVSKKWLEGEMLAIAQADARVRHKRLPRAPEPRDASADFAPGELKAAFEAMGWRLRVTFYPFAKDRNAFNGLIRWGFVWVHNASRQRIQIGRRLVVNFGYLTPAEEEAAEIKFKTPVEQGNFDAPYLLTCLSIIRQPRVLRALLEQPEFNARRYPRERLALLGLARITVGNDYPRTIRVLGHRVRGAGPNGGSTRLGQRDVDLTISVLRRLASEDFDLGDRKIIPTWPQIINARAALAQRQMQLGDPSGWVRLTSLLSRNLFILAPFLIRTIASLRLFGLIQNPWRKYGMPLEQVHDIAAVGDSILTGAQALLNIEKPLAARGVDINRFTYSAVDAVGPALRAGERAVEKAQQNKAPNQRLKVTTHERDVTTGLPWADESQDIAVTGLLGSLGDGAVPVGLSNGEIIHLDRRVFLWKELNRILRDQGYVQLLVRRNLPRDVRHALTRFGFTVITEPNAQLRFGAWTLMRLLQRRGRIQILHKAFERLRSRFYGASHVIAVKTGPTLSDDDLRALADDKTVWNALRGFSDFLDTEAPRDRSDDTTEARTRRQPEDVRWDRLAFNQVPGQEADPTGMMRAELQALMQPGEPLQNFQRSLNALIWAAGRHRQDEETPTADYLTDKELTSLNEFLEDWNDPTEQSLSREAIQWIMTRAAQTAFSTPRAAPPAPAPKPEPRLTVQRPIAPPEPSVGSADPRKGPSLLDVFDEAVRHDPTIVEQVQSVVSVLIPETADSAEVASSDDEDLSDDTVSTDPAVDDLPADVNTSPMSPAERLLRSVELSDVLSNVSPVPSGAHLPAALLTPTDLSSLVDFLTASLRDGNWSSSRWRSISEALDRRGHGLPPEPELNSAIAAASKVVNNGRNKGTRDAYDALYRVIDQLNSLYFQPHGFFFLYREPADAARDWPTALVALTQDDPLTPFAVQPIEGLTPDARVVFYAVRAPDGFQSTALDARTRVIDDRLPAAHAQSVYQVLKEAMSSPLATVRAWVTRAYQRLGFRPAMIRRAARRGQRMADVVASTVQQMAAQAFHAKSEEDPVRKSWVLRTPAYSRWPALPFVDRYLKKPNAPISALANGWTPFAETRFPDHARADAILQTFALLNTLANAENSAAEFARWSPNKLSAAQRWAIVLMLHNLLGPDENLQDLVGTGDDLLNPAWTETHWPAVTAFLAARANLIPEAARRALDTNFTHWIDIDNAGAVHVRETRRVDAVVLPLFKPADAGSGGTESTDRTTGTSGRVTGRAAATPLTAEQLAALLEDIRATGLEGMDAAIAVIKALAPASLTDRIDEALIDRFLDKPTLRPIERHLKDTQLYVPGRLTGDTVLWVLNELGLVIVQTDAGQAKSAAAPLKMPQVERLGIALRTAFETQAWPADQWRIVLAELSATGHPFPVDDFQWAIEDLITASEQSDKHEYYQRLQRLLADINVEYLRPHYLVDIKVADHAATYPDWKLVVMRTTPKPLTQPVIEGLTVPFQVRHVDQVIGDGGMVHYVRDLDVSVNLELIDEDYARFVNSGIPHAQTQSRRDSIQAAGFKDLLRWYDLSYGSRPTTFDVTSKETPEAVLQQTSLGILHLLADAAYRQQTDASVRAEWDRATPPWAKINTLAFRHAFVAPQSPLDLELSSFDRTLVSGEAWLDYTLDYSAIDMYNWLVLFSYGNPALHFSDILSRFYNQDENAALSYPHALLLLFLTKELNPADPVTMAELLGSNNRAAVHRISDLFYSFKDQPEKINHAARAVMAKNFTVQLAEVATSRYRVTNQDGSPYVWGPAVTDDKTPAPGLKEFFVRAFQRGTINKERWAQLRAELESAFGRDGLDHLDALVYVHNRIPLSDRGLVQESLGELLQVFNHYLEPHGIELSDADGKITRAAIAPATAAPRDLLAELVNFVLRTGHFSGVDAAVVAFRALLPDSLRLQLPKSLVERFIKNPKPSAIDALLKRAQLFIPSRLTGDVIVDFLQRLGIIKGAAKPPAFQKSGLLSTVNFRQGMVEQMARVFLQACTTGHWPDSAISDLSILGMGGPETIAAINVLRDAERLQTKHLYYQELYRLADHLNADFFQPNGLRIVIDPQESGAGPTWLVSVIQLKPNPLDYNVEGLAAPLRVHEIAADQKDRLPYYDVYMGGLESAIYPGAIENQVDTFLGNIPGVRETINDPTTKPRVREALEETFFWSHLAYGQRPTAAKMTALDVQNTKTRSVAESIVHVLAAAAYENAPSEAVFNSWNERTPPWARVQAIAFSESYTRQDGPAAEQLRHFKWPVLNENYPHPDYTLGLANMEAFRWLTTLANADDPFVQLMDAFTHYFATVGNNEKAHVLMTHSLAFCLLNNDLDPEHPLTMTELVDPNTNWEAMRRLSRLVASFKKDPEALKEAVRRAVFASYTISAEISADHQVSVTDRTGLPVFLGTRSLLAGNDPKTVALRSLSEYLQRSLKSRTLDQALWPGIRARLVSAFGEEEIMKIDDIFKAQDGFKFVIVISQLNDLLLERNGFLLDAELEYSGWQIELIRIKPNAGWPFSVVGFPVYRVRSSDNGWDPILRAGIQTRAVTSWARLLQRAQGRLARYASGKAISSGLPVPSGTVANYWFERAYGTNPTAVTIARFDESIQRFKGGLYILADFLSGRINMNEENNAPNRTLTSLFARRFLRPGSTAAALYADAPDDQKPYVAEQLIWLFALLSAEGTEDGDKNIGEFIARLYDAVPEDLSDHEKWFMQLLMRRRDWLVDRKDRHAPLNTALTIPEFARGMRDMRPHDISNAIVTILHENFLCWLEMRGAGYQLIQQRKGAPIPFPGVARRDLGSSLKALLVKKWLTSSESSALVISLAELIPGSLGMEVAELVNTFAAQESADDLERTDHIERFIELIKDYLVRGYGHLISYDWPAAKQALRLDILPQFLDRSASYHVTGQSMDFNVQLASVEGVTVPYQHPIYSAQTDVLIDLNKVDNYKTTVVELERTLSAKSAKELDPLDRTVLDWLRDGEFMETLDSQKTEPEHYVGATANLVRHIVNELDKKDMTAGKPGTFVDRYVQGENDLGGKLKKISPETSMAFFSLLHAIRYSKIPKNELINCILDYRSDPDTIDGKFILTLWAFSGKVPGAPKLAAASPELVERRFVDAMLERLLTLDAQQWRQIAEEVIHETYKIRVDLLPNHEAHIVSTYPSLAPGEHPAGEPVRSAA